MIIQTPAIVLKSFPYGDTSIIARCFSKQQGKISLIIKGARSKKSQKGIHFQPLNYVELISNIKVKRIFHKANRVGDHIWYISDTKKFKKHYPNWKQKYNTRKIIGEIIESYE